MPKTKIVALRLNGFTKKTDSHAFVLVGGAGSNNLAFSIGGPNSQVAGMREALINIFDSVKPWYQLVTRVDFVLITIILTTFCGMVVSALSSPKEKLDLTFLEATLYSAVFVGGLVALDLTGWGLNRLRARVFPSTVFRIGHGIVRDDLAKKMTWGVVASSIVGLEVSFIFKLVG